MGQGRGTVNKVILLGRLGTDPQIRYTPSGRATVSFTLATNRVWKDQNGTQQEKTEWHRIVAWGKLAEVMSEWLKKGQQVYLEGRLQTRSYEDPNGVKRWITEVLVTDMEMLGGEKKPIPEAEPPTEIQTPPVEESEPSLDVEPPSDLPF